MSRTASDQHQPASLRATATLAITARLRRMLKLIQHRCRRLLPSEAPAGLADAVSAYVDHVDTRSDPEQDVRPGTALGGRCRTDRAIGERIGKPPPYLTRSLAIRHRGQLALPSCGLGVVILSPVCHGSSSGTFGRTRQEYPTSSMVGAPFQAICTPAFANAADSGDSTMRTKPPPSRDSATRFIGSEHALSWAFDVAQHFSARARVGMPLGAVPNATTSAGAASRVPRGQRSGTGCGTEKPSPPTDIDGR